MPLQQLAQGLLHLFYPRLCEGCSKPLLPAEQVLCLSCGMHIEPNDYNHIAGNDTEMRLAGRIPFSYATSFAPFINDGLLQHLLHGLKYQGKKEIGIYLGKIFAYSLQQTDWIATIDAIVPVPLHAKKQAARGYNQCMLIAAGMSDILRIPVISNVLIRTRHTESQTQKTRAERVQNMQDAFAVKDAAALKGKHLLLVDDVLTTGATLEACALSLLKIEGVKVCIGTIGIAV
jgi:ComF family protein